MEGVIPWAQKAVLRGAASAGFNVIFVQALEFVTKSHAVRRNKAQPGKAEFDLALAGSDREKFGLRSAECGMLAVHQDFLDDDGGR